MESLTVLYDNKSVNGFVADWGFSVLVETEDEMLLFDTGAKPEILKENGKKAQVQWESIDYVFISHNHWDHVGGLSLVLEKTLSPEIFIPEQDLEEFEETFGTSPVWVPVSTPTYLSNVFISTGVMATGMEKPSTEHSLLFNSSKGFILITGCSHPGILNVVKRSVEICGKRLFLVIGGFHLYKKSAEEIEKISLELKDFCEFVAPCHCTGELGIEIFKNTWKDRFVEAAAGVEIPLEEV